MGKRAWTASFLLLAAATASLGLGGCGSTPANRDPRGELFPEVTGTGLDGTDWRIPADFAGEPTVLLVGYVQEAQFDADRWLLGLLESKIDARIHELPTIDGLFPRMIGGWIDDGMRQGIPEEDWASVITVYGDADRIVDFTGRESPRNIRVLLLDAEGRVVWFHDRGYSARTVLELRAALAELEEASQDSAASER